jgi:hypothetical protein
VGSGLDSFTDSCAEIDKIEIEEEEGGVNVNLGDIVERHRQE